MSRSFFDLGQRLLRFQRLMFDFWPLYSGERFRASGPPCCIYLRNAQYNRYILQAFMSGVPVKVLETVQIRSEAVKCGVLSGSILFVCKMKMIKLNFRHSFI